MSPPPVPTVSLSLYIHNLKWSTTAQTYESNALIKRSACYISSNVWGETIILCCHRALILSSFFREVGVGDWKTINKRKGSSFWIYKLCLIIHLPLMRQSAGNVFSPRAYKIRTDSTNLHAALDSIWATEAWFLNTQHIILVEAAVRMHKITSTII